MAIRNTPASTAKLVTDIASASSEVIACRVMALSDPRAFMSPAQLRDVSGMVSEKVQAGMQGWIAGSMALWLLPARMTMAVMSATPGKAADQAGALLLDVANAALSPTRSKVVANRAKLRKRRGG